MSGLSIKAIEIILSAISARQWVIVSCDLEAVGYKREELALPVPDYSLHHYALFQEYFHFREKFLFFRITALQAAIAKLAPTNKMHILIPLKDASVFQQSGIDASCFSLNCVPIINLFDRPSDPIRIHGKIRK